MTEATPSTSRHIVIFDTTLRDGEQSPGASMNLAEKMEVAQALEQHPAVLSVSYPGLPDSPYHELARRYMPRGTGAVFTFGVKGGYRMGIKVVEACELLSHLANIGDTRSLIIHPASTTHRQLDEAQLRAAGAGPEVIRLSIGLETAADIIADLEQALAAAERQARASAA